MGSPLTVVFAVAVLVALVTAAGSWRRREGNPAAGALALIMTGIAAWSAVDVARSGRSGGR